MTEKRRLLIGSGQNTLERCKFLMDGNHDGHARRRAQLPEHGGIQGTVRLADAIGVNQAAKRLGSPESSLGNWESSRRRKPERKAGTVNAPWSAPSVNR
jgi:hypothetical protein